MFCWRLAVCMSVCNAITFASLDVENSFFVSGFQGIAQGSSCYVKVKVTGAKRREIPYSRNVEI